MAPIFFVMFFLVFMLSMCQNGADITIGGGYDEEMFQDYADDQYALHFSNSGAYEDNLLIVVLTEENHSDFYYIAWKGDHLDSQIDRLMGNNATALGQTMNSCINESNYKYSLDSNLADVMNTVAQKIMALGLESSFTCKESRQLKATFVNNTDLPMTVSTVEAALQNFADSTGIPVVLVVEDAADVFGGETKTVGGNSIPWGSIIAVAAVIIVIVVVIVSKKKPTNEDPGEKYRQKEN